jgi:hypothetical protein
VDGLDDEHRHQDHEVEDEYASSDSLEDLLPLVPVVSFPQSSHERVRPRA